MVVTDGQSRSSCTTSTVISTAPKSSKEAHLKWVTEGTSSFWRLSVADTRLKATTWKVAEQLRLAGSKHWSSPGLPLLSSCPLRGSTAMVLLQRLAAWRRGSPRPATYSALTAQSSATVLRLMARRQLSAVVTHTRSPPASPAQMLEICRSGPPRRGRNVLPAAPSAEPSRHSTSTASCPPDTRDRPSSDTLIDSTGWACQWMEEHGGASALAECDGEEAILLRIHPHTFRHTRISPLR
mmetsp:Transcript_2360/g.3231  ORF Transcript_2360/g.3231 Transcript_2360/m.3231 type:complete len:239 (+) Transcript_2360:2792-3508(+)